MLIAFQFAFSIPASYAGYSRDVVVQGIVANLKRKHVQINTESGKTWVSKSSIRGKKSRIRPTSDALERYRQARADLAELDVRERRGRLVDRGVIREGLNLISSA